MADSNTDHTKPVHVVGPYAVYGRLAAGGMATVHLGRVIDPEATCRTVAIKRLHPQFSKDPEFVAMFIDEAKLAARVKHPNVVETLTTLTMGQELLLVMEYIRGECFSKLLRAARRKKLHPSVPVVGRIIVGMLRGLHAAHEVKDDDGNLLNVVHRDISPQNVMIGVDGHAKVLDFGVAKASARIQITRDGQMKGKLSYMSPEQLKGAPVDRRADVFACGVVLWEALTRKRLFVAEEAGEVMAKILREDVPPPSAYAPELSPEVDAVVLRALHKDNAQRYQTAEELALDLERVIEVASPEGVGEWIESVAGEILGKRARLLADIESTPIDQSLAQASQASFADSKEFEELQSWAERESARVMAQEERGAALSANSLSGNSLSGEALSANSLAGEAKGGVAHAEAVTTAGGSSVSGQGSVASSALEDGSALEDDGAEAESPTTVSLPPELPADDSSQNEGESGEHEEQTAVTLTVAPELSAVMRAERETIAPVQPRPPPLPAHLRPVQGGAADSNGAVSNAAVSNAGGQNVPVRRTRWGLLLSVAATVLGLVGAIAFQLAGGDFAFFSGTAQKRAMSLRPQAEGALRPVGNRAPTVADRRRSTVNELKNGSAVKDTKPLQGLNVADLALVHEPDAAQAQKPSGELNGGASNGVPAVVRVPAQRKVPVVRRRRAVVPKVVTKRLANKKRRVSAVEDCSVPFWVDARGIRRLKVACL